MPDMDDPSDWQRRIEAIRGHLVGAAAGIGVAALIIMLAPVSITTALGLHNPGPLAAKIGLIAGAVWALCGFV